MDLQKIGLNELDILLQALYLSGHVKPVVDALTQTSEMGLPAIKACEESWISSLTDQASLDLLGAGPDGVVGQYGNMWGAFGNSNPVVAIDACIGLCRDFEDEVAKILNAPVIDRELIQSSFDAQTLNGYFNQACDLSRLVGVDSIDMFINFLQRILGKEEYLRELVSLRLPWLYCCTLSVLSLPEILDLFGKTCWNYKLRGDVIIQPKSETIAKQQYKELKHRFSPVKSLLLMNSSNWCFAGKQNYLVKGGQRVFSEDGSLLIEIKSGIKMAALDKLLDEMKTQIKGVLVDHDESSYDRYKIQRQMLTGSPRLNHFVSGTSKNLLVLVSIILHYVFTGSVGRVRMTKRESDDHIADLMVAAKFKLDKGTVIGHTKRRKDYEINSLLSDGFIRVTESWFPSVKLVKVVAPFSLNHTYS